MRANNFSKLAQNVVNLENQGVQLTSKWAQFEPGDAEDIAHLKHLADTSLAHLTELEQALKQALAEMAATNERRRLEHAYNIVEELLQSRAANQSLLEQMSNSSDPHHVEFFRALAIKEKAAAAQAKQLEELLVQV